MDYTKLSKDSLEIIKAEVDSALVSKDVGLFSKFSIDFVGDKVLQSKQIKEALEDARDFFSSGSFTEDFFVEHWKRIFGELK